MDISTLNDLLERVKAGELSVPDAIDALRKLPYEDLGFAKIDHHRSLRQGFPEVIFCQGKTPCQTAAIFEKLATAAPNVLATRATIEHYNAVKEIAPDAQWMEQARIIRLVRKTKRPGTRFAAVLSAGTSDIPVAEEAVVTAETLGTTVHRAYDVGVAGLHRLLELGGMLYEASALIVVAGMEGALPSVVAGLVKRPVIAVPTSVGYGASFEGLAALLAMLNCCAVGVAVVNIDNGFGAGCLAHMIIHGDEE